MAEERERDGGLAACLASSEMSALSSAAAIESEVTVLLERALAAVTASRRTGGGVRRVWFDVGTWKQTLTREDLLADESLVVVGLEAYGPNLNASNQPSTDRFVRVAGACSSQPAGTVLTFNQHTSPSCGTLLPVHPGAPRVGKGRDACVGDTPQPTRVRSVPLSLLIERVHAVLRASRIELIKIDVQGSELDCLASAGRALRSVDNVLLEAQDATERSGLMLYQGSRRLPEIDAALGGSMASFGNWDGKPSPAGLADAGGGFRPVAASRRAGGSPYRFTREYCEWNTVAKTLREINCLYHNAAHPHASWLWATGNRQLVAGRWGSIVSYGPTPCWLRPSRLATDLLTVPKPHMMGTRLLNGTGRGKVHTEARLAQLRGVSPLKNESELEQMLGVAPMWGRAPPEVAQRQRRFCEKYRTSSVVSYA